MHAELLQMAADLTRREEPFVLAVVVRRRPPSSAQLGDMAVITADGAYHGWLGGSCTRPTVAREAQAALADGRPRLVLLTPEPEAEQRPGIDVFPMTCHSGGTVEIYLEPVLPAPRLAVFGASPTARALAALGKAMGWPVAVVAGDPVAGAAEISGGNPALAGAGLAMSGTAGRAPAGAAEPAPPGAAGPAPPGAAGRTSLSAVVATMGEDDEEAIRVALSLQPAYLGVVASARRFGEMRETLLAQGVAAADLDRIRCPAGLDLGARTPEEIALSVVAEIVARRRSARGASDSAERRSANAGGVEPQPSQPDRVERQASPLDGAESQGSRPGRAEPQASTPAGVERPAPGGAEYPVTPTRAGLPVLEPSHAEKLTTASRGETTAAAPPRAATDAAPAEAVDPVCGMTVRVAGARHSAEHAGHTYYFCCGGCRQRFLADPQKYLALLAATPQPAAPGGAG